MKKLVIILIVFAITVGAMVSEIVYVNKFYNSLQADLEVLSDSIEQNKDGVDNPQTVELCENIATKWEMGKRALLMMQNHNTVRNFDEKIVCLKEVIKSDNYNDAVIFVVSAINYIDDVLLDSVPYLTNIL